MVYSIYHICIIYICYIFIIFYIKPMMQYFIIPIPRESCHGSPEPSPLQALGEAPGEANPLAGWWLLVNLDHPPRLGLKIEKMFGTST